MALTSNEGQADFPSMINESGTTATSAKMDLLTQGSGNVYAMILNNVATSGAVTYFKAYDTASPTPGTTEPDFIFRCTQGTTHYISVKSGMAIANALSVSISAAGGKTVTSGFSSFLYTIFGD